MTFLPADLLECRAPGGVLAPATLDQTYETMGLQRRNKITGPHLQLLNGRSAERVTGAQQHPLTLQAQAAGNFADGGGLSRSVDPHLVVGYLVGCI